MSVAIYYLLFKVILTRGGPDYIEFLFLGLITWKWLATAATKSGEILDDRKKLIKKIYIPKYVFPMVETFYHTWKFLVVFAFVIVVYAFVGYTPNLKYFWLPVILLAQLTLILGIGGLFSAFVPFAPDLKFVIAHIFRLAFYPAGVLFSLDMVPEKYVVFIKYNVIAQLLQSYRDVIMYNSHPSLWAVSLVFSIGIVLCGLSLYFLNRFDEKYAKLI